MRDLRIRGRFGPLVDSLERLRNQIGTVKEPTGRLAAITGGRVVNVGQLLPIEHFNVHLGGVERDLFAKVKLCHTHILAGVLQGDRVGHQQFRLDYFVRFGLELVLDYLHLRRGRIRRIRPAVSVEIHIRYEQLLVVVNVPFDLSIVEELVVVSARVRVYRLGRVYLFETTRQLEAIAFD